MLHLEEFRFDRPVPTMAEVVRQLGQFNTFPIECTYLRRAAGTNSGSAPCEHVLKIIVPAHNGNSETNLCVQEDTPTSFTLRVAQAGRRNRQCQSFLEIALNSRDGSVLLVCHINPRHNLVGRSRLALRQLGGRHVGLSRVQRQRLRKRRVETRKGYAAIRSCLLAIGISIATVFGAGMHHGFLVLMIVLLAFSFSAKAVVDWVRVP